MRLYRKRPKWAKLSRWREHVIGLVCLDCKTEIGIVYQYTRRHFDELDLSPMDAVSIQRVEHVGYAKTFCDRIRAHRDAATEVENEMRGRGLHRKWKLPR